MEGVEGVEREGGEGCDHEREVWYGGEGGGGGRGEEGGRGEGPLYFPTMDQSQSDGQEWNRDRPTEWNRDRMGGDNSSASVGTGAYYTFMLCVLHCLYTCEWELICVACLI